MFPKREKAENVLAFQENYTDTIVKFYTHSNLDFWFTVLREGKYEKSSLKNIFAEKLPNFLSVIEKKFKNEYSLQKINFGPTRRLSSLISMGQIFNLGTLQALVTPSVN